MFIRDVAKKPSYYSILAKFALNSSLISVCTYSRLPSQVCSTTRSIFYHFLKNILWEGTISSSITEGLEASIPETIITYWCFCVFFVKSIYVYKRGVTNERDKNDTEMRKQKLTVTCDCDCFVVSKEARRCRRNHIQTKKWKVNARRWRKNETKTSTRYHTVLE